MPIDMELWQQIAMIELLNFIEKPNSEDIKPYIKKSEMGEYVLASMGIYIFSKRCIR